jgi:hypothetical protein
MPDYREGSVGDDVTNHCKGFFVWTGRLGRNFFILSKIVLRRHQMFNHTIYLSTCSIERVAVSKRLQEGEAERASVVILVVAGMASRRSRVVLAL